MAIESRQYDIRLAAAFKKTGEKWGDFSNMAGGYPVIINGISIPSVEALYQACRFPLNSEIQEKIIKQNSPMTAKMVGKPHRQETREDWDIVRVLLMKWVLRVKLAQHWDRFSAKLLESGDMPIVELSNRDNFWGAIQLDEDIYCGVNALGRLLMELRQQISENDKSKFMCVLPLNIDNFLLLNQPIGIVTSTDTAEINVLQEDMFDK